MQADYHRSFCKERTLNEISLALSRQSQHETLVWVCQRHNSENLRQGRPQPVTIVLAPRVLASLNFGTLNFGTLNFGTLNFGTLDRNDEMSLRTLA
jgi:hypothetical protein